MALTPEELRFLATQGYGRGDVFDARGMSSRHWKAAVRSAGKTIVLGASCSSGGHRLRTRSGHCIQCDTSKLAYQNRHHSPGYIYIAGSLAERVVKIGSSVNVPQREGKLNFDGYGDATDWEMLFSAHVGERGKVEHEARALLFDHEQSRRFIKDGATVDAREVLDCSFSTALDAVRKVAGDDVISRGWKSRRSGNYEF